MHVLLFHRYEDPPITKLHLGPNHTQVIELLFIIALAKEYI